MAGEKPKKDGNNSEGGDRPKKDGTNYDGGDKIVAKTAGLAIFAGIAASIFKAFKPKQPAEEISPPPYSGEGPAGDQGLNMGGSKKRPSQKIEIFEGDTLWSLSRKYGVSVDQIKAANGFTDDTIYAGEKIIIP
uniref:TSA: Wollemia nobilis Ref_Wollemi_Transcript_25327_947 transcribed RNA sequence n=1 Tax=Wollemia nobilis TaxID=56998 RepID=A0A0C9RQE6_9CONI